MAPAGQGQAWSHILCCLKCDKRFSSEYLPVNLACGHVVCNSCVTGLTTVCPSDELTSAYSWQEYPVNVPLLSICVNEYTNELANWKRADNDLQKVLSNIEEDLLKLASYLKRAESERGGSVFSEVLSRTMQRKLVALICYQLVEEDGRSRALKTCRALVDRIIAEVITINSSSNPSTQLWSEVRARGCQFLGPAMQEDVLKLILLALGNGAQIARKTLVIYVVQKLTEDYPQVSKTCVGHVVQLLYRASCFHVIKRDGESSLMQLKEEFRTYETLRKEHDAQIVHMAMEAGLKITPDQWSSLLYGDWQHRPHMQSIIDKLQSPQSYQLSLDGLEHFASNGDPILPKMLKLLTIFGDIHPFHHEAVTWEKFAEIISALAQVVELHVSYIKNKNEIKQREKAWRAQKKDEKSTAYVATRYKTRMCRDAVRGQLCPRGSRCTFAHFFDEIHVPMSSGDNVHMPPSHIVTTIPAHMNQQCEQPNYQMAQTQQGVPNVGVQRLQIIHAPPPNPYGPITQHVLPQAAPEVVPMVPMVPVVQSPGGPHAVPIQPPAMLLMSHPPPPNVMVTPKIWQSSQQAVFLHPTSPQQPTFWLSTQTPGFSIDNGREAVKIDCRSEPDPDQLVMKRKEILSRLAPFTLTDDEEGDDSVGHVSYTVASSVLDERMELHPHPHSHSHSHSHPLVVIGRPPLELPPIPAVMSPNPNEENIMMRTSDMVAVPARPRAPSVPFIQSVQMPCETLVAPDGTSLATVQSDCTAMQICETICQPLPTAVSTVAFIPALDPCGLSDRMAVMPPPPPPILDPQGVVSSSLDKIVDVKERLNEAEGATMSSAVSQQLRVELQIAEREMDLLDPRTQASCLLRELQQVDRELERIEAARPAE